MYRHEVNQAGGHLLQEAVTPHRDLPDIQSLRPHPRTGDEAAVAYRAKHIRRLFAHIDQLEAEIATLRLSQPAGRTAAMSLTNVSLPAPDKLTGRRVGGGKHIDRPARAACAVAPPFIYPFGMTPTPADASLAHLIQMKRRTTMRIPATPASRAHLGQAAISPLDIKPGQHFWLCEPWSVHPDFDDVSSDLIASSVSVTYERGGIPGHNGRLFEPRRIRPSQEMPLSASGIGLVVTQISVAQLHSTTDNDAMREGIYERSAIGDDVAHDTWTWARTGWRYATPLEAYRTLWDKCHPDVPWRSDPTIFVIAFDAFNGNINQEM